MKENEWDCVLMNEKWWWNGDKKKYKLIINYLPALLLFGC
jgi:hypothetical protein